MSVFEYSKWIWLSSGEGVDQYAEFRDTVCFDGAHTELYLSCDNDYTLYINGAYVASNQYGDYEHYKIYDTVDITEYLSLGENKIDILVYHCGHETSRYKPAPAGLIYDVVANGESIAHSGEHTLSRRSPTYESGRQVLVSYQLGFTFFYDATKEGETGGYARSVIVDKQCELYARPTKKAVLYERKPMVSVKRFDGCHYLIDLGAETVGVPVLELESDCEQTITVTWGEHIVDGGVRKTIGYRNFYFEYKAKSGKNDFIQYMLRLGCRYIEVFSQEPIRLDYAGVMPQVYEVAQSPCVVEGELERRIYDICVNTLKLCMMEEHYVDCPWREQSLYSFDSRNQMLCGYYAFEGKNAEYARANLKLISMDRRDDRLLSICYPCGVSLAIPSFSLYYAIAVWEYISHTGDASLAGEVFEKLSSVLSVFLENRKDGLCTRFPDKNKWNFYDWSQFSDGNKNGGNAPVADLLLNCLLVMALDSFEKICASAGVDFPYGTEADALRALIRDKFKCGNGFFTLLEGEEQYTALGNALAILSGVAVGEDALRICRAIADGELLDCSLSMKILVYEALLNTDTERYSKYVLDDIAVNYKKMLDFGSDTVWETIDGESAFKNAGSLCHGWSAVPVYIYHRLGVAK